MQYGQEGQGSNYAAPNDSQQTFWGRVVQVSTPQPQDQHTGWQPMQTTQQMYMAADDDSGTDTDTSSDDGTEQINTTFDINGPEHIVQEQIYWQMRNAKRLWRRYTYKPVRKV